MAQGPASPAWWSRADFLIRVIRWVVRWIVVVLAGIVSVAVFNGSRSLLHASDRHAAAEAQSLALEAAAAAWSSAAAAARPPAARAAQSEATGTVAAALRVVIDPGHGGSNRGAMAAGGMVTENEVTLAVARLLGERLRSAGYTVRLTREQDEFLSLRDRSELANRFGADAFISLHANATAGHQARGFETYLLSTEASRVDAPALRSQESVSSAEVPAELGMLVADLERRLALPKAQAWAENVQRELAGVWPDSSDRGVKRSNMHVLLGATMPAILVEMGFIDHPVEGRRLLRPEIQQAIADALARSVIQSTPFLLPSPHE